MKTLLLVSATLALQSSFTFAAQKSELIVSCASQDNSVQLTLAFNPKEKSHRLIVKKGEEIFRDYTSNTIIIHKEVSNDRDRTTGRNMPPYYLARRGRVFDLKIKKPMRSFPGTPAQLSTGNLSVQNGLDTEALEARDMDCLVFNDE